MIYKQKKGLISLPDRKALFHPTFSYEMQYLYYSMREFLVKQIFLCGQINVVAWQNRGHNLPIVTSNSALTETSMLNIYIFHLLEWDKACSS